MVQAAELWNRNHTACRRRRDRARDRRIPKQTKAAPVPRDDGLCLDDVNGRAPDTPCLREWRPQPVGRRESKTWTARSVEDRELVSERDAFQVQRGAGPDHKPKRVDQREDDGRHETRLSENASNLN